MIQWRPIRGSSPISTRPKIVAVTDREAICTGCRYNLDWICEHIGCRTCSGEQRKIGGLRIRLADPTFRCAAGKF